MRWLENLKTVHKLRLGFGIGLWPAVMVGVIALSRMVDLNKAEQHQFDEQTRLVRIKDVDLDVYRYLRYEKGAILNPDPANVAVQENQMHACVGRAHDNLAYLDANLNTPEGKKTVDALKQMFDSRSEVGDKVLALVKQRKIEEARRLSAGQGSQFVDQID